MSILPKVEASKIPIFVRAAVTSRSTACRIVSFAFG